MENKAELNVLRQSSNMLTQRHWVIALLMSSILLPGIQIPGLWHIRLEELVVLVLMPLILTRLYWRWNWIDLCFGALAASAIISMVWGLRGKGAPFSPRDLMELVKLAKSWLFFRLALFRWTEVDIQIIAYWLLGSMGVSAFFGIVQWQNWLGLGTLLERLYSQDSAHIGRWRIMGTMISPNYFALLMTAGLVFAVAWYWYKRHKILLALQLLLVIVVLITFSRTGIMAIGIAVLTMMGISTMWLRRVSLQRWLVRIVAVSVIVIVLGLTTSMWLLPELDSVKAMNDIQRLAYSQQSPLHRTIFRFSFLEQARETRVGIWRKSLEDFGESPLFGWGPGKASRKTIADNGYVLYLRRYGLVGLMCFLLLYWQILNFCWRLLRLYPYKSPIWIMALAIMTVTLAYLAANMFMEAFYELQLMSFFWLVVGIGYSTLYFYPTQKEKSEHEGLLCT